MTQRRRARVHKSEVGQQRAIGVIPSGPIRIWAGPNMVTFQHAISNNNPIPKD